VEFWEVIKAFGGVVGLLTGGFVLFDRLTRDRPNFILMRKRAAGDQEKFSIYLRVSNPSYRPIILRVVNGSQPGVLSVFASYETKAIIDGMVPGKSTIVVDGGTDTLLPIWRPDNFEKLDSEVYLPISLRWKYVQPHLWLPWRLYKTGMTKRDYQAMLELED
jgi:hypothetical protein